MKKCPHSANIYHLNYINNCLYSDIDKTQLKGRFVNIIKFLELKKFEISSIENTQKTSTSEMQWHGILNKLANIGDEMARQL